MRMHCRWAGVGLVALVVWWTGPAPLAESAPQVGLPPLIDRELIFGDPEIEAFLATHLGGRFQEGGTPDVVQRLREITVDPKTVTRPASE